jgi:hypothetical protein
MNDEPDEHRPRIVLAKGTYDEELGFNAKKSQVENWWKDNG